MASFASPLNRNYVIRTAQVILNSMSDLTDETVKVLLEAHRKNPLRLAEHLNIALPIEVRAASSKFVEMMTRPAPES
jgi:hypothetical protein